MLLSRFSVHPGAPGALLRALYQARPDDPRLGEALLEHPNTPPDVIAHLTQFRDELPGWRRAVAAATRAHCPPAVLTSLADDNLRHAWVSALTHATPSQLDALITLARDHTATRNTVVPAIIDAGATTPAHVDALARALVWDPQPLPAVRTWLASLLTRRGGPLARTLALELAAVSPDQGIAADLLHVADQALRRDELTAQVIADAAGGAAGWLRALAAHPDPDGAVSRAALRACADPAVARAVAELSTAPWAVRGDAYLRARRAPGAGWEPSPNMMGALLACGSPTLFADLTHELMTETEVLGALTHMTLAPAAVGAAWRQALRLDPDRSPTHLLIAAQVAAHPNAPVGVRQEALAHLDAQAGLVPVPDWDRVRPTVAALAGGDTARAAELLPVSVARAAVADPVSLEPLITAILQAGLPALDSHGSAALLALEPDFHGTLLELLRTAAAVAST